MIRILQLKLPVGHTEAELKEKAARELRVGAEQIKKLEIVRRSVDARREPVKYVYQLNVAAEQEKKILRRCAGNRNVAKAEHRPYRFPAAGEACLRERPVIVGSGPAGLFCGYMLARHGYAPLILERGDEAAVRREKVEAFWKGGALDVRSNVQFGEGGAGTFSDGKLNTLVKDPAGRNREVMRIFAEAGAPSSILYDQKPHLGTDVLVELVQTLRRQIEEMGGSFRFGAQVTDLLTENKEVRGVEINGRETIPAQAVVLAIGHSARDTFEMLRKKKLRMEPKSFAVGVRIEHPQEMITRSQYGEHAPAALGAASYKVTHQTAAGRGVYSFCMCPGGYVVNASSEPGRLAVNGMSYQDRGGPNANSAMIVTVTPEDFQPCHDPGDGDHVMDGIRFQRYLEETAFGACRGRIPVQLFEDFKERRASVRLGDISPCIKGDYALADVRALLPAFIGDALAEGIVRCGEKIPGFDRPDALLSAVESRTSSPVRILRGEDMMSSVRGLYPCGEGAGYAGGITSAAMDGLRAAEAVAAFWKPSL